MQRHALKESPDVEFCCTVHSALQRGTSLAALCDKAEGGPLHFREDKDKGSALAVAAS